MKEYPGQLAWSDPSPRSDKRAVHLQNHPQHKVFLTVLKHDIFKDPITDLGNLTRIGNQSAENRVSNWLRDLGMRLTQRKYPV